MSNVRLFKKPNVQSHPELATDVHEQLRDCQTFIRHPGFSGNA